MRTAGGLLASCIQVLVRDVADETEPLYRKGGVGTSRVRSTAEIRQLLAEWRSGPADADLLAIGAGLAEVGYLALDAARPSSVRGSRRALPRGLTEQGLARALGMWWNATGVGHDERPWVG